MLGLPGAKLLAWLVPCVPTPRARRGSRRRRRRVATCTSCVVRAGLRGGARRSHALPPATALITYPIHARIAGRRPPWAAAALSVPVSQITFVLGPQNDKTTSLGGLG